MRALLQSIVTLAAFAAILCTLSRCERPRTRPATPSAEQAVQAPPPRPNENAAQSSSVDEPVTIAMPDSELQDRWIHVLKVRENEAAGVATADFDREKNKITVTTKGVARFSLDTGREPIDWSRPVVLRIDGYNAILKKRENPVIEFEVTLTGEWVVQEKKPPEKEGGTQ